MINQTIEHFINELGSEKSTPGGGSAAAVTGAIGISLTQMVVSLTTGKARYAEHQTLLDDVQAQATVLTQRFIDGIQEDIAAFNHVMEAYRLPAQTEDEKCLKQVQIEATSKEATIAPFNMMETSVEALRLSQQLLGKSNPNVLSDLGVAALNLSAALQSSWLNVLINLKNIQDEAFVSTYRMQGTKLLAEGKQLANELYQQVLTELA
ncbi:cyclodeaminase/cyclohydrolase family protein [Vagococcus zengguangii]|uniref:Cyclodeaminase/cyclohydrolase family protein n=1 Tax=Vagococcus zengguangii TaxID=2571750 RepID=A0A4D7CQW6_9ENTE|nr:cyclodeaminase/cyclohydrolase family protein [Vagococcus zengguangii]QCI86555.1 cyclodeaminase/cyclohydrolase family protein [Vagococcus zengguangii]TLG81196.1 cyclodeaminase/cyclohydrolase family protein [Vagococcus zengguangii]